MELQCSILQYMDIHILKKMLCSASQQLWIDST